KRLFGCAAFSFESGVYMAASMGSEMMAAAAGTMGEVRRDPMAMLPFCGYNMADYFKHWLKIGKTLSKPPRIFGVNWFRTDENGKFMWPGFGENMRVLKWIVDRVHGRAEAVKSALGMAPRYSDLDWKGMSGWDEQQFGKVMSADEQDWKNELASQKDMFDKFSGKVPQELERKREELGASMQG
ncbi:MAG: phosphoenolpyruvate carboxykinase (GTP), partial [Burkholderiales bacterium]|nr:phosphoenolpyruvate carboxykinase (GTP) [Burkholderiales bacterium]